MHRQQERSGVQESFPLPAPLCEIILAPFSLWRICPVISRKLCLQVAKHGLWFAHRSAQHSLAIWSTRLRERFLPHRPATWTGLLPTNPLVSEAGFVPLVPGAEHRGRPEYGNISQGPGSLSKPRGQKQSLQVSLRKTYETHEKNESTWKTGSHEWITEKLKLISKSNSWVSEEMKTISKPLGILII